MKPQQSLDEIIIELIESFIKDLAATYSHASEKLQDYIESDFVPDEEWESLVVQIKEVFFNKFMSIDWTDGLSPKQVNKVLGAVNETMGLNIDPRKEVMSINNKVVPDWVVKKIRDEYREHLLKEIAILRIETVDNDDFISLPDAARYRRTALMNVEQLIRDDVWSKKFIVAGVSPAEIINPPRKDK